LGLLRLFGNLETFLNSHSPEGQTNNLEKWQNEGKDETRIKKDLAKEMGRTAKIRMLGSEPLNDDEMVVDLFLVLENGTTQTPKMKLQKVGNEWKLAGPYKPKKLH
jgi:hypothetical protein